jgi:hypothetical protein
MHAGHKHNRPGAQVREPTADRMGSGVPRTPRRLAGQCWDSLDWSLFDRSIAVWLCRHTNSLSKKYDCGDLFVKRFPSKPPSRNFYQLPESPDYLSGNGGSGECYSKCQKFFPNHPENPLFEKSRFSGPFRQKLLSYLETS